MNSGKRILLAGIGNIFLGDDGFGCEVIRQLSRRSLPSEVEAKDFGIRSYDLAYALLENYDVVIFLDASPQGQAPGTLQLIEPDLEKIDDLENGPFDGHALAPVRAVQLAKAFGQLPKCLYLVACEPADLGGDEGHIGLSEPVAAAIPVAIEMIESLIGNLLNLETRITAGIAPV